LERVIGSFGIGDRFKLESVIGWRRILQEDAVSQLSDEEKAKTDNNWRLERSRQILAKGENRDGIDPLEIIVQHINGFFHTSLFSTPQKTADTRGYDQLSLQDKCRLLSDIKYGDGGKFGSVIVNDVFDCDLRRNLRSQNARFPHECQEQLLESHRKLSGILPHIAMKEGSFSGGDRSGPPISSEEIAATPYEQRWQSLLSLLPEDSTFDTDRLLQEYAFKMGEETATTAGAAVFAHLSDGRPSSRVLASDSFYRRCFHLGFRSSDPRTRYRWFKPAGSSPNPFFTDPLADLIIEAWEILRYYEGHTRSARVPEASDKDTNWLSFLKSAALANTSAALPAPKITATPSALERLSEDEISVLSKLEREGPEG
jgi:hypothetical protein